MIAYKAVTVRAGLFCPWTWMGRETLLIYKIGQQACSPRNCGPLACFGRLADACAFIEEHGSFDRRRYPWPELILRVEVIERSAEKRLWTPEMTSRLELPKGTIFVDRLKVLGVAVPRSAQFQTDERAALYRQDYATCREVML